MSFLRKRLFLSFLYILGTGVLSAVAWKMGHQAGIREGMQDSFYAHMLHANQELSSLTNLHLGKTEAIRSNLETGLGLSVAMLAPKDRVAFMAEKTRSDAMTTLAKIKAYRKESPYTHADENFRKLIDGLLEGETQQ